MMQRTSRTNAMTQSPINYISTLFSMIIFMKTAAHSELEEKNIVSILCKKLAVKYKCVD